MEKIFKQVKVQLERNSNEFGIFLVPVEDINEDVYITRTEKAKIIKVYNLEIKGEI